MARKKKKLGEILIDWKLLNANDLADALKYAAEHSRRIGEALVDLELCNEEDVTKALAAQSDMQYVDLDKDVVPPGALKLIPEKLIKDYSVIPLSQEDGKLRVIISDPLDLSTLDLLHFRLNMQIEPCLASAGKIKKYLERTLNTMDNQIEETMQSIDQDAPVEELIGNDPRFKASGDEDAPIIRLINLMIAEAVRSRASDIHIEPMADRVRVRYRIDGVCLKRDDIPLGMKNAVTTRMKIISGIDIAERRLPQDGRIKMRIGGKDIDFRVSSCPGYHGESIVLRILRPDSVRVGLPSLGFEEEDLATFHKIIRRPNGIFLVTGPTGSGKTTTLYSALQELNRPDKKIITAEDPVEYNFTGINQCQVREDIGLTFAAILRSMLRQAPNIILVGEIRDREVGDVAIQAALTGHLVFSTLHTNDAPSAITRLIDMGVKPFLVASSVQAVMAQRLIRIICEECKTVDPEPDRRILRLLGFKPHELEGKTIMRGAGCSRCSGTGYRGRKGIFELMIMNNELRELAFNRGTTSAVRKAARASGMRPLLEDGKRKILKGMTTPDEVARVAQAEGIAAMHEEEEEEASV
jgi:type IV pilus assembly protein PilB